MKKVKPKPQARPKPQPRPAARSPPPSVAAPVGGAEPLESRQRASSKARGQGSGRGRARYGNLGGIAVNEKAESKMVKMELRESKSPLLATSADAKSPIQVASASVSPTPSPGTVAKSEPVKVEVDQAVDEHHASFAAKEEVVWDDDSGEDEWNGNKQGGYVEFENAADLWSAQKDYLDPITLPLIPKKYKRVNDDVRWYFSKSTSSMASVQSDTHAHDTRKLILFQIPAILSTVATPEQPGRQSDKNQLSASSAPREEERASKQDGSNPFRHVDAGRIGKIRIHKSGKAKLVLGESVFDVNPGLNCSFVQELGRIDAKNSVFASLSGIQGRLVCTPDVETLLKMSKRG